MIVEAKGDVISLSGSLMQNHWLTIKAASNLLLKEHPEGIIIDCSGITQCTLEGVKTFKVAVDDIERVKARIILVHIPPNVWEMVRQAPGVRSSLAVAKSMDEARASLKLGLLSKGPDDKQAPVVMVPLLEGQDCVSCIHQACVVARERQAVIYLVCVLEVPRSLALNAPQGDRELQAQTLIDRAEELVRKEGLTAKPYIQRGREYSQTLLDAASSLKADIIVLGLPGGEGSGAPIDVADTLLRRATCEVMVSRTTGAPPPSMHAARETQRLPD